MPNTLGNTSKRWSGAAVCVLVTIPWAQTAAADARQAVMECRKEPAAEIRLRCFDRASALLGDEMQSEQASQVNAVPTSARSTQSTVSEIKYDQGRPRFVLRNGQIWQSEVQRRLTPLGDGKDIVRIDKTPVGFLLHFNGSLFGLPVDRVQ